jgi:hypothetical protein
MRIIDESGVLRERGKRSLLAKFPVFFFGLSMKFQRSVEIMQRRCVLNINLGIFCCRLAVLFESILVQ